MERFERVYEAILKGDNGGAVEVAQEALDAGDDPQELIDRGMIPAMAEVGRRFEDEVYFVPELLLSARAMKGALALLRPLLAESGGEKVGSVVLGTVQGDLHDIGKNLVAAMLQGCGFRVIDLGVDVSADAFIESVQEKEAQIVALSALLTTTMVQMKAVIEALEKAGIRDKVKVIIGGAPITQQYADEIGADGYSDNASAAVNIARKLVA